MEDNLSRYLDSESSEGSGNREYAKEISIKPSAVVRIVEPETVVKCWRTWPLCDDGKKRSFVIGNDFEGDSLLAQMLGDYHPYKYYKGGILESEKDELTGQKRYIYEAHDPELFLQLIYNNDKSSNNGSWKPTREFAFNGIDRAIESQGDFMGQLWCDVHKHTELLKMPITGFEKLKSLIEQNGKLDEYDVYYSKEGSGRNTTHNISKAGDKNALAVFGFISAEELAYEKYDLKEECKLSSATYILKYLAITIQRIDNILGTNFFDQLTTQSKIEKELWGVVDEGATHDIAQVSQPAAVVQVQTSIPAVNLQAQVPPPTTGRVPSNVVQAAMPQVQVPVTHVAQTMAPPAQTMVPPAQTMVPPAQTVPAQTMGLPPAQTAVPPTHVTRVPPATQQAVVQGRVPVATMNAPVTPTIICPFCQTEVPANAEVCIQCSNRLMEPCQKCKTMFSITSTKCPNEKCGAVYKLG